METRAGLPSSLRSPADDRQGRLIPGHLLQITRGLAARGRRHRRSSREAYNSSGISTRSVDDLVKGDGAMAASQGARSRRMPARRSTSGCGLLERASIASATGRSCGIALALPTRCGSGPAYHVSRGVRPLHIVGRGRQHATRGAECALAGDRQRIRMAERPSRGRDFMRSLARMRRHARGR
jgi:hypothetical protein